jgi:hypothetical protein
VGGQEHVLLRAWPGAPVIDGQAAASGGRRQLLLGASQPVPVMLLLPAIVQFCVLTR